MELGGIMSEIRRLKVTTDNRIVISEKNRENKTKSYSEDFIAFYRITDVVLTFHRYLEPIENRKLSYN